MNSRVAVQGGDRGRRWWGLGDGLGPLKPGERVFLTRLEIPPAASGMLDVRVRLTAEDGGLPLTEAVRLDLSATDPKPMMFRRGPTTGPQLVADLIESSVELSG